MEKVKCMIIDDERDAIDRLERLLLKVDKVQILPSLNNPVNAKDEVLKWKPDILFLDVEMPDKTGFEVVNELKENNIQTCIVFVTAYDQYAIKAIKAKAYDYLLKPVDIDELKSCIKTYCNDTNRHLTPKTYQIPELSERENEVLNLVFKGLTSQQIADKLFISKHTVDYHRKNILQKTGCKNFSEIR